MSADIREALLRWYHAHKRALPWTEDAQPYRVWLSEVMLQQTQVETVIPYFRRFIAALPTVAALAAAELDAVLKLWEGLGYYRRAHNVHRAARLLVAEYNGQLPRSTAELQKLPGIGRYTAGAIASIAFGIAAPALDANVMRVYTRLLNLDGDIRLPATQNQLWQIAADWLPAAAPGDFNQALMQLGQQICRPQQPLCGRCPLSAQCQARAKGLQAQRPVRAPRPPKPHYDVAAGLIRDERARFLIAQRPLDGLLGGLWEFPGGKLETGESLPACLKRELREELAIEVAVGEIFTVVRHAFTHFKITLYAFDCRYVGALPPHDAPQALGARQWRWARLTELAQFSFGKADRQVIAELMRRRLL